MFIFQLIKKDDLPFLFKWLALPHVAEWWRESRDYEQFAKKYGEWIEVDDVGPYFIMHDYKPIGYIAWYDAAHCPLRTEPFPQPTFGLDLFIADLDYVGKGYGATIIKQFVDKVLLPMNPKKIIVDPEISNTRSIHVFEKAGFKKTSVVESTDGTNPVMAQFMEISLE